MASRPSGDGCEPARTRRSVSDVTTATPHGRTASEAPWCRVDMDLGRSLSYQGLHYVPNTDTPTTTWPVQQPRTYNPYPPTHPDQDENRSADADLAGQRYRACDLPGQPRNCGEDRGVDSSASVFSREQPPEFGRGRATQQQRGGTCEARATS